MAVERSHSISPETLSTLNVAVVGPVVEGIIANSDLPPLVKIIALGLNGSAWLASLAVKIITYHNRNNQHVATEGIQQDYLDREQLVHLTETMSAYGDQTLYNSLVNPE